MAAQRKRGEPDVLWPYDDPQPPTLPEPYKLRSERQPAKELDEPEPQMAEAPGGALGSYLREVKALRKQMADMPKFSKNCHSAEEVNKCLPQTPSRKSGTPQAADSPIGRQTQQIAGILEEHSSTQPNGKSLSKREQSDQLQLAIIPSGLPDGLVRVEVKPKEIIQTPEFMGQKAQRFAKSEPEIAQRFSARPYWEDASEENKALAQQGNTAKGLRLFRRRRKVAWLGALSMLFYLCALGFYLWVRITKTLDLGPYRAYGVVVLVVECLGASTVVVYGVSLLFESIVPADEETLAYETREQGLKRAIKEPYHVRVLIPCYKEPLMLLRQTVMAALTADMPRGCKRTVYLCDDGKDPEKQKWVDTLGPEVQYVSGRKRPVGEMNGKSGNLNSCAAQLYPRGCLVPSSELMCVFDADQVAGSDFFLRTVPLFDGGSDVGMVLSPQCFHNLIGAADVFNHSNIHFWEYMQPGYDALGFISCTGTNFLIRATAFIDAGGSPTYTLTEDFALGMEMLQCQWKCRYVPNYLVVGEAPVQVRNAMQQRSRWVKGHFQIMFSWQHCPLFQWKLSLFMRIMYLSGVWNYIVGAISTPLFILVPIITIWFGIFPIIISWWMALALTIYMAAMHSVMYNIRKAQHFQALWFANCCNTNLWWVYAKAIYRALASTCGGNGIKFKTTVKGTSALANSAFRDIWLPVLVLGFLLASIVGGLVKIGQAYTFPTPLAISVLWAGYQVVPPLLLVVYTLLTPNSPVLVRVCLVCLFVSFACGIAAVGLLWHSTYADYDFASGANTSTFFHRLMMVGNLPIGFDVPWRSSALLQEATSGPAGSDISGGWLTGAMAGNLKMTMPAAFTTAMIAWGLITFPGGYAKQAAATTNAQAQIVWGADYLLKTLSLQPGGGYNIIYQVGNYTEDQSFWGRPEDITSTRPYFTAPLDISSANTSAVDLGSSVAAALLAAYVALPNAANAASYLSQGLAVYKAAAASTSVPKVSYNYAKATSGTCGSGSVVSTDNCTGSASELYSAFTYNDFVLWAAAWAYRATGNSSYLADAQNYQALYLQVEGAAGLQTPTVNWGNVYWAANLLLAQVTTLTSYGIQTQTFLNQWMCNTIAGVTQLRTTSRGRIFSYIDPALGTTANAALVAVAYATLLKPLGDAKARIYTCWAQQQIRYMLGDSGRSLVVGTGSDPPTYPEVQSASCPLPPAPCDPVTAEFSAAPNPLIAAGGLIYGDFLNDDAVADNRLYSSNMAALAQDVQVEYNAGFQGALAGLAEYDLNWYQCKVNYGITVTDQTFCSQIKREGG